jgi:two-component sensor histidine kinase
VKNNLTAILGLIFAEQRRLDAESSAGEGLPRYQAALSDLGDPVRSLATVHGLLSSGAWRPLRVDVLVEEIIRESLPATLDPQRMVVEVAGAPVLLAPEQAHHLALIIGELTTNTAKYGCRTSGCHIRVRVGLEDEEVRMTYRDDGPGYPDHVLAGQGHSVGLGLVKTIATHSLRGSWSIWNEEGPVTEIRFPADREASKGGIGRP